LIPDAYAISGKLGYDRRMSDPGNQLNRSNSAEAVPKSVLVDRWFDWEGWIAQIDLGARPSFTKRMSRD